LAKRFLDLTNAKPHKNVKGFTKTVSIALLEYEWPGNVRQLRSTIRRAVLLADDEIMRIPTRFDHPFRAHPTIHSGMIRPAIPDAFDHPFRRDSISRRGKNDAG